MDGEQKQEGASANAGGSAEQVKQDAAQAQKELKEVAGRAKAATAGFSFEKLFRGRIDNMNYLYFAVGALVLGYILAMIPIIGMLASLALAVLGIGATIRRRHDVGQTGWFTLLNCIPFLGIFAVIYLCWKKGTGVTNTYGEAPDPKRDLFKAVLNT